jgi:hypothetical protein
MSKGSKSISSNKNSVKENAPGSGHKKLSYRSDDYIYSMSHAPAVGTDTHWFQMLLAVFFTSVIIIITRMTTYSRPMSQFSFWADSGKDMTDFFSYHKMVAIFICAILVLIFLLYRVFAQAFYIKRSYAYIPMMVYSAFVLLSYAASQYKVFALWGWNDRFEGTVSLISYMILLFYIINAINSESNVRSIINSLAAVSSLLGLLGITQASNHDFFKTNLGKHLITPSWYWPHLDTLDFTFTNQIYQTVYNINYVSFYLTLLIPIFGILFIRSMMEGKDEPLYKKVLWGAIFTLLVFNLIGSASSGGLMGMAFVVLMGLIVLNKRIIKWWKPVLILLVLTMIVSGLSYNRWLPELSNAVGSTTGSKVDNAENYGVEHKIDYMITSGDAIRLGYKGEEIIFTTYPSDPKSISIEDSEGKKIGVTQATGSDLVYQVDDERFNWISVRTATDQNSYDYIGIITDGHEWYFRVMNAGTKYRNNAGKFVDLVKVPAIGWEDNQSFGSGRGYIWSRTIPMLKSTLALGHGADTYCIYFPHNDYIGKYNSGTFTNNVDIIVDKPHNMYFGTIVGTGGISMLALLALWGIYIVQSFMIYRKENYSSYLSYVGAGIFFGIFGFLVSGLVDDSTVSVMPMFYGLLGTGIAINMMLKKKVAK